MAAIRTNQHGTLSIGFRYRGVRHFLSTGLPDTKPNRQKVRLKAKAIEYDISLGRLDVHKYFPQIIAEGSADETLSDFFTFYVKEKTIRPSSWRSLNWAWDGYISPYFGAYKLKDISKHEVLVFRNFLLEKGLANGSANLIMTHLACILTRAHEEGKIPTYPMKKLGKLDNESQKVDPFSFEELRHFLTYLEASKPEFFDMVFIWSRCGFRMGEILALKWSDIDYLNAQLNINRTLLNDGSEGPPKTKNSKRTLPLRPAVVEAFKRQEKRSRMACDYIFPDPRLKGRYVMPVVYWRQFKNLLIFAGLRDRSPNQLRHTFATLHIAAGENITWVSKMLGHRNVSTTLERYNKYIPNLTRNDGSAFEAALGKTPLQGFRDKLKEVNSGNEKGPSNVPKG
jgi:integrase